MKYLAVLCAMLPACLVQGQTPGDGKDPGSTVGLVYSTQPIAPTPKAYFDQMEIGSIAGVSYEDGRYLLFATKSGPGKRSTVLYKDAVIQLARLVVAVGDDPNAAMSMDFVSSGRKKYAAKDVLDVPRFAEILGGDRPIAAALRQSPLGAETLQQARGLKGETPKKELREHIAELLNQARSRPDLETLLGPADLLPETQIFLRTVNDPVRRNRIVLDDFFQGAIDKDIEDRYQVVYKASSREEEETMTSLLVQTRASAIWTAADSRLKMMIAGLQGMDYAIGPSQIVRCAEESRDRIMRGQKPNYGQVADYFALDVDEQDMAGVGESFRNPALMVLAGRGAGLETPECATKWSAALSKRMQYILQQRDDPLSGDLNALLQILLLHRAMVYLLGAAPLDIEHLDLLARDAEVVPSTPPNVVKTEIAFGVHGNVQMLEAAGGICFGQVNQIPPPHSVASPELNSFAGTAGISSTSGKSIPSRGGTNVSELGTPRFVVNEMGNGMLQIDVTSILAPDPRHLFVATSPRVVEAGAKPTGVCGGITGTIIEGNHGSANATVDQDIPNQLLTRPRGSSDLPATSAPH